MQAGKRTTGTSSIFDIGDQPADSRVASVARYNHDEDTSEAHDNKSRGKQQKRSNNVRDNTQLSKKRPKKSNNAGNNDLNFTVEYERMNTEKLDMNDYQHSTVSLMDSSTKYLQRQE